MSLNKNSARPEKSRKIRARRWDVEFDDEERRLYQNPADAEINVSLRAKPPLCLCSPTASRSSRLGRETRLSGGGGMKSLVVRRGEVTGVIYRNRQPIHLTCRWHIV